jgi:tRNA nucleotidyltransferase/poly(A) polymerase
MSEIKKSVEKVIPTGHKGLLLDINRSSEKLGYRAYLVGGIVRDILLGRRIYDLDVVIEGDALKVANCIKDMYGYPVKEYSRFRTATVVLPNGWRVDFVTARRERYPAPGALPEVQPSNLYDDLYRRDFSVNAMAVSLSEYKLIDYFGGNEDLRQGVLRVLHNRSFVDDPTRIFRCIRFKVRYGFTIEEKTRTIMSDAIKAGYPLLISTDRLSNELKHMFMEKKFGEMLKEMVELGIWGRIFDGASPGPNVFKALDKISEKEQNRQLFISLALLDNTDSNLMRGILQEYLKYYGQIKALRNREKGENISLKSRFLDNAQLYRLFSGMDKKVLSYLLAVEEDGLYQRNITRYLEFVSKFPFHIDGEDLKNIGVAPGPAYGRFLAEAKEYILNKEIIDREKQVEALKKLVEGSDNEWE